MSANNIDRLSTLPEEITSHILSLMPTKFAVRTSILSRKWRYSWTTVTSLVFEDLPLTDFDNFLKFMDRVLEFCRSPQIHLFRLCLRSYASKSKLLNWIDKAVRLNVCELDIQTYKFEFPSNLLTCKTLTKLRLYHRSPAYSHLWVPSCQMFNLPCLKTLDIIFYSICPVNAFKLINGCPILESLTLKVYDREDEDDYIFNISTLKRLEITVETASMISKVVLRVPNLEYLSVGGILCSLFVMENVPASID